MATLDYVLFAIYPYLCLVVFVGATLYRFEREPYSWQAASSQLMRKSHFAWASNLFHVGILAIAGGHVGGLLVPAEVYHLMRVPDDAHQKMELVMGSVFGSAALVGLCVLTYRRVIDRRVRLTSAPTDLWISLLLLATLVLGLLTLGPSFETRDEGIYLHKLSHWAQLIVTLRPTAAMEHLAGVPMVFKVHMFAGMTVFLVFPFTRLVHVCSAPLGYLVRGYTQIVRAAQPHGVRGGGRS